MLNALVGQILMMAAIMLIGYCLRKGKMIDGTGTAQISSLVLYVANPVLIAQSLMIPFEATKIVDAALCGIAALVVILLSIAGTKLAFRPNQVVERYGVIFCNCGFIGIPLVQNVLGSECVFYLSVVNTVSTALLWTYGACLMANDRAAVSVKRVMLNPAILALVVGLICFACSFTPPAIVDDIMTQVANLNTGLVMIVLGSFLASSDLRGIIRNPEIYRVCALRLLAVPLVLTLILMPLSFEDPRAALTAVVTVATPAASTTAMFAEKFGADYRLGSGVVAITTLTSLITMPLVIYLVGPLLGVAL